MKNIIWLFVKFQLYKYIRSLMVSFPSYPVSNFLTGYAFVPCDRHKLMSDLKFIHAVKSRTVVKVNYGRMTNAV